MAVIEIDLPQPVGWHKACEPTSLPLVVRRFESTLCNERTMRAVEPDIPDH